MSGEDNRPFHNPSLPLELNNTSILNDELINNTIFSKHKLFEILLNLLKQTQESSISNSNDTNVLELDENFEKDLCDLWDISIESDVCKLLNEYEAIDIFDKFIQIHGNLYPRANEILIGIIANMISTNVVELNNEISLKLVMNETFILNLLNNILYKMQDIMSLIQLNRLLTILLNINDTKVKELINKLIINEINNELFIESIAFILNNSLNIQLIDSLSLLLVNLLDNELILNKFSSQIKFIESLCTSNKTRLDLEEENEDSLHTRLSNETSPLQISNQEKEATPQIQVKRSFIYDKTTLDNLFKNYLICLQSISTCENGVKNLDELIIANDGLLINLFTKYTHEFLKCNNDWEVKSSNSFEYLLNNESTINLNCLLSILNCILMNNNDSKQLYNQNDFEKLIRNMIKIVKPYLSFFKREDVNYADNLTKDYVYQFLNNLKPFIPEFSSYTRKLFNDCKVYL